ncbi:hypothetical protein ACFPTO_07245 [Paraburkholderia denitrificans]|uniref:Uncharacterized protein n=1 Tax=Paraburkholderia denitrificans TaxID=694025 RepID=A0ABW0J6C9_9BURK
MSQAIVEGAAADVADSADGAFWGASVMAWGAGGVESKGGARARCPWRPVRPGTE